MTEINKMKVNIEKLKYKVDKVKEKLEDLGIKKDNTLSQNYKRFAKIYENYISKYHSDLEQEVPKYFLIKIISHI